MGKHILILEGDGIGPEIVREARKVLDVVNAKFDLGFTFENELMGGCAIDVHGVPLADSTLERARLADAKFFFDQDRGRGNASGTRVIQQCVAVIMITDDNGL